MSIENTRLSRFGAHIKAMQVANEMPSPVFEQKDAPVVVKDYPSTEYAIRSYNLGNRILRR